MTAEYVIDLSSRIRATIKADMAVLTEAVKDINKTDHFNDVLWAHVFANNAAMTLTTELQKLEHAITTL